MYGPFVYFVDQDEKNSTQYIVNVYQTGLSMPDREYYIAGRSAVRRFPDGPAHMEKMFTLAGYPDREAMDRTGDERGNAARHGHWTQVENRDRDKTYNKMALTGSATRDAHSAGPVSPGRGDSHAGEHPGVPALVHQSAGCMIASTPLPTEGILHLACADGAPPISAPAFVEENFAFFGKTLTGSRRYGPAGNGA